MKRSGAFLLVVFLFLWVGAPPIRAQRPVLRLGLEAAGVGVIDPHFAAATHDRAAADLLFNGLVRYVPGNAPHIEPDLAESIPQPRLENGRQVWSFQLRRGVWFHPGPLTEAYEMTADDVTFSYRRAADPKHSAYAGEYQGMTFEAADRYTVRITLDNALSPILFLPKVADYAGGFVVSRQAVEAMGDEGFKAHPVGTGPFMFERHEPGRMVRLAANNRYFRGAPRLSACEIHFLPKLADRELGLLEGRLDVIRGSLDTRWVRAWREKGFQVDVHGVGQPIVIHFNLKAKPFDDVRVRRAVAYAMNRDGFLSDFGRDVAEKVFSPVPANDLPGGLTGEEVAALGLDYPEDLGKARRLLAEAGYPNGFTLDVVSSEMAVYLKIYESLREQLSRVGIRVNIEVVDHSAMHERIRRGETPLVVYGAWRPNADAFLTRFFHSESSVVTGARPDTNFSFYDQVDDLIQAARWETNPTRQVTLWKLAQIRILNDLAAYPVLSFKMVHARDNDVNYGHELIRTMALYPQITERTEISGE